MPKIRNVLGFSASLLAVTMAANAATGAATGAARTDWPAVNHDNSAVRYSPLTQVNPGNVKNLRQVWIYHLKPNDFTGPLRYDESIPIVIGNTLYLGSPYGEVIALNATTGDVVWKFKLPNGDTPAKRGISYWPGDGTIKPQIVFGTNSGLLYELNAADGTLNTQFGENGVVNVKTPDVMNGFRGYSILQAPAVYKNLLVVGGGTGEGPGGSEGGAGPAGDTRAFDARSGKLVWTFHTVPRPGETGYDSWDEPESTIMRSGVNTWGYFSVDEARHILFMPLGAPNNDRVGIDRPGNGLFGSSVVAVNADTGAYMWHFQMVHHDAWDYDAPQAPLLVDIRHGGKTIPAVLAMNKASLLFTLDRVTGKPIFPVEERAVPASDVPGEKMSPTQPFPAKPRPLGQHTVSRDNLYKGDPTLQSYCEHMADDNHMKLGGPFLPIANNQYSISPPGPAGGVNFWGGTFDPKRNLFVTNVSNVFQPMRLVQGPDGSWRNQGPLAGLRRFGDVEHHLLCGPAPWGELVAVNMDTGDVVYDKSLGVSDMLAPQYQNTGRPGGSGAFTTASGLIFIGATDDNRFRAFKTATGEKVWETKLDSSIEDSPITYQATDGRQFIAAIATGGGIGTVTTEANGDELIVWALPKK
ncbi:MAG TPA: PQQ-binding-like beta-propeller repeat protein [Rhizomicrobium sp.]|jgi:quinoprotein glucose dehydrogenase